MPDCPEKVCARGDRRQDHWVTNRCPADAPGTPDKMVPLRWADRPRRSGIAAEVRPFQPTRAGSQIGRLTPINTPPASTGSPSKPRSDARPDDHDPTLGQHRHRHGKSPKVHLPEIPDDRPGYFLQTGTTDPETIATGVPLRMANASHGILVGQPVRTSADKWPMPARLRQSHSRRRSGRTALCHRRAETARQTQPWLTCSQQWLPNGSGRLIEA